MSATSTGRLSWVDYAKVICIYLMIACHAGQKGLILDMTYQFHMPAFFIISGMLYRQKGFRKEILSFGVPILFCGMLSLGYKLAMGFAHAGFSLDYLMGGVNRW